MSLREFKNKVYLAVQLHQNGLVLPVCSQTIWLFKGSYIVEVCSHLGTTP